MYHPSKSHLNVLLTAVLIVLCLLHQNVFALDLKSDTFISLSVNGEKNHPMIVYSVLCDNEGRCQMTLDFSGEVISRPLEVSNRLLLQVEATLKEVKEHSYPHQMDREYKALDGLHPTNCWSAGELSGVGGLCRFSSASGTIKWVVLWGDMCSATCYSGFVPLYVVKK